MKRSQINQYLAFAKEYFKKYHFRLPPWAFWSPADWAKAGAEYDEIRQKMLGWDLTDFGSGNFEDTGLLLFTLRNGSQEIDAVKNYAEKLMIALPNQVTPIHYHVFKAEDIINREGGKLVMQLWYADQDNKLSDSSVSIQVDGVARMFSAGEKIRLSPGESVTIMPQVYHTFWAEEEACIVGEVSRANNDLEDNFFYQPTGRFPEITEDEPASHLLCNEYPANL